jgi:excisionase family DNA binding protein
VAWESAMHAELAYFTRRQAATMFSCSDQLISKLIKNKKLRAFKLGRKVLIHKDDLLALLREWGAPCKK